MKSRPDKFAAKSKAKAEAGKKVVKLLFRFGHHACDLSQRDMNLSEFDTILSLLPTKKNKHLNFSSSNIGAEALMGMLSENNTITKLDLSFNPINPALLSEINQMLLSNIKFQAAMKDGSHAMPERPRLK